MTKQDLLRRLKNIFSLTNILVAILILALAAGIAWMFRDAYRINRSGQLRLHPRHLRTSNHNLSPANVQPWMTFGYINMVFRLPSTYFRGTLGISDARYPNMSISRYAKDGGITSAEAVSKIQQAITQYNHQ